MTVVQMFTPEQTERRARFRVRLIASFAMLVLMAGGLTGVTQAATGIGEMSSAQAAVRVCAPNGKCVYTNNYCPAGSCGQQQTWKRWNYYCSSSVGCFTWMGKNYVYNAGPKPTAAQKDQTLKCAASLGFTYAEILAGGPVGFLIAGVTLAIWGCT